MIESDGRFIWEDDRLYGGIRQDVTESVDRYRVLRNLSVVTKGSLTKVKGLRQLYDTALAGGAYRTYGAIDARYSTGAQQLVVSQDNGTNGKLHIFDPSTRTLSEQSVTCARTKPWMGMFANKLYVLDGNTIRAKDMSHTWTTPGTATVNASTFGVVYANRLICFGASPYEFNPSATSAATWDDFEIVIATNVGGEPIKGAARCGRWLLVGGDSWLRAYQLGTASAYDWDWESVSEEVGPVNWQSMKTITRTRGGNQPSFCAIWTKQGPSVCVDTGQGPPRIVTLHDPLRRMCMGQTYQGLQGLNINRFDQIEASWCPEYNQVRFACSWAGSSAHRVILSCDADSIVRYAMTADSEAPLDDPTLYPYWSIRDNSAFDFPVSTLFSMEVDPDTGLPSTTGLRRTFCAEDGLVYEMDALDSSKDLNIHPIAIEARRDGFDGAEDRIREREKSLRGVKVRTTQVGNYNLKVRVVADGGKATSEDSIDLSNGILLYGDSRLWGDGNLWNQGEFVTEEAGLACLGQKFDITIYDEGSVEAPVEINSLAPWGYVEDRV